MKPITLKERFTDIIDDRDNHEITDDAAVELCEKVTLEFAKNFAAWYVNADKINVAAFPAKNTVRYTAKDFDQLISEYQEHISLTKSESK